MCGLLASISKVHQVLDEEHFGVCLDQLEHRGPDGRGVSSVQVANRQILLGHRRLSIFDVSSAGAQPMTSPHGCTIVYNGEVFNWIELREELISLGHRFRTECDTEVILAAYREWGSSCVSRFVGFWSLVLFDPQKQEIFVSRDRFGIKPLFMSKQEDSWVLLPRSNQSGL